MIYACTDHFERALDDFVLHHAAAPDILFTNAAPWGAEDTAPVCCYCGRPASYVFQRPVSENEHAEVLNP